MQDEEWITFSQGRIKKLPKVGSKKEIFRKSPRYIVPWEVAIVESGTLHSAVIADLSLGGLSLYYDKHLHSSSTLAVTIKIPAYLGRRQIIVGAECRILYSILSSDMYGKFRIVLKFVYFRKNGRRDLQEALSSRVPIGEYPSLFGE